MTTVLTNEQQEKVIIRTLNNTNHRFIYFVRLLGGNIGYISIDEDDLAGEINIMRNYKVIEIIDLNECTDEMLLLAELER